MCSYINHALLNHGASNCVVTLQLYLVVCCHNKTTAMALIALISKALIANFILQIL